MRVMVTGGTGFIGSHTVNALLDAGHRVRLLVRSRAKAGVVFAARPEALSDLVVGDVTDKDLVDRALDGVDAVVHAAALVALEARRAREVYANNCRAVDLVVGGAQKRGIPRIVYVSSASVFRLGDAGAGADAPMADAVSAYARSKIDAERSVRRLQEAGAPIVSTYPTGVIGPDDPGLSEANHGISSIVNVSAILTSSGFQSIDVRDLAAIHARILEEPAGPERYIAGGHFQSWRELADLIDEVGGGRLRRVSVPGAVLRASGRVGDVVKRFWDFDFPMTRESMAFATRWTEFDSERTTKALGVGFRDPKETLADVLRWLVAAGHIAREKVPRLVA